MAFRSDNAQLPLLNAITQTLLVATAVVASLHFIGLIFTDIQLAASGVLAVHSLVIGALLQRASKKLAGKERAEGFTARWVDVFFNVSTYCMAIICLLLSGQGLFNLWEWQFAFVLFLLPGVACWWSNSALSADDEDAVEEEPYDEEEEKEFEAFVASEASRPDALAELQSSIGISALVLPYIPILFLALGGSFLYYSYLEAAYFDGDVWGWAQLLSVLSGYLEKSTPTLITVPAVLFLFLMSIGVWNAMVHWRQKGAQPDIDRDLSDYEFDLIKDFTQILENYVADVKVGRYVKMASWLVVLAFFGAMFGSIFIFALSEAGLGASLFEAGRVAGNDWYIYRDDIGATEVSVAIVIIMSSVAIPCWLTSRWKEMSEYNILGIKTDKEDTNDKLGSLRDDIALDVRKRVITHVGSFTPSDYLRYRLRAYTKWIYILTAMAAGLTVIFWGLDRRDYDLITPAYAEYTNYWTGAVYQTRYEDAEGIEITCYIGDRDNIKLYYDILMPDGYEVSIVSVTNRRELREDVPSIINQWRLVDAKLRDVSIARHYGNADASEEERKGQFNEKACHSEIRARIDRPTADAVLSFLGKESRIDQVP